MLDVRRGAAIWQAVQATGAVATLLAPGATPPAPLGAGTGATAIAVLGEPPYAEGGRPLPRAQSKPALPRSPCPPFDPTPISHPHLPPPSPTPISHPHRRLPPRAGGDTLDLTLRRDDAALVAALAKRGWRVVVVLLSGRPLVIPPETLEQM